MTDPIVGIDLGTSNTVVAHATPAGAVQVLADANGFKIHPSVVSFHPTGGVVVGAAAKQRKVIDPKNTIYSVKRLIGRSYGSKEVQTAKQRAPFQIKEGANQLPLIVTRGGEFAVPEISAIVLDYAKNVASSALATQVTRAVVTVPASFNDAQRSATATAGSIAGLTVVRVLNEPTAAALAYGTTRNLRETIAVFDFGGGTFDITILKLADQVYEVLGTAGDTFLGGDDLDERLVDRMVEKFLMENRVDLRQNEVSMMRLRAVAEQVKIELSRRSRAMVRIDEIAYGPKGKPLDLQIEIKRDEFVRQVADIIDRTFPVCDEALKFANLTIDHIDDVILVGGTTKIPYVRDQVAKFFAKAPRTDVNPEDAVAVGAALQASALERSLARKKPSRQVPLQPFAGEEITFGGETASKDTVTAAEAPVMAELPLHQATDELLELLEPTNETPPVRHTAGYRQVEAPKRGRPGERAVSRGEHRDIFEERTPPPPGPNQPVIGRMTKQNLTAPTAGARPPPTPRTVTQPVPIVRPPAPPKSVTIPAAAPPGPASTLRGIAPVHEEEDTGGFPNVTTEKQFADIDLGFPDLPTTKDPLASTTAKGFAAASATPQMTQQLPLMQRPPGAQRPAPPAVPSPPMPIAPASAPTIIVEPETSPALPNYGAKVAATAPASTPAAKTLSAPPPANTPAARTLSAPPPASAPAARTLIAPQPASAPAARTLIAPTPQTFPVTQQPPTPVVMDVTPRGLGIGTVAGFCEELIRRNSRVPTEIRKLFTTSRDSQDSVRIIVCQGESRRLDNNTVIGDLRLDNLPLRPRGETSIEVTFALDASGILQVRARDPETGREQRASLDIVGTIQQQDVEAAREKLQQLRR